MKYLNYQRRKFNLNRMLLLKGKKYIFSLSFSLHIFTYNAFLQKKVLLALYSMRILRHPHGLGCVTQEYRAESSGRVKSY